MIDDATKARLVALRDKPLAEVTLGDVLFFAKAADDLDDEELAALGIDLPS